MRSRVGSMTGLGGSPKEARSRDKVGRIVGAYVGAGHVRKRGKMESYNIYNMDYVPPIIEK